MTAFSAGSGPNAMLRIVSDRLVKYWGRPVIVENKPSARSNLHIYAAMRGQSLDEFLQTRNAPGAIYSVAAVTKEPFPETTA